MVSPWMDRSIPDLRLRGAGARSQANSGSPARVDVGWPITCGTGRHTAAESLMDGGDGRGCFQVCCWGLGPACLFRGMACHLKTALFGLVYTEVSQSLTWISKLLQRYFCPWTVAKLLLLAGDMSKRPPSPLSIDITARLTLSEGCEKWSALYLYPSF